MGLRVTVFTDVHPFYENLVGALNRARRRIYLAYYGFSDGIWPRRIARALSRQAAAGLDVRLLVDEVGLYLDCPPLARRNGQLWQQMRRAGVQAQIFRPGGRCWRPGPRLHCKYGLIDDGTLFFGGSNVGDQYLAMRDTNLRLDGAVGEALIHFHHFLLAAGRPGRVEPADPGPLQVGPAALTFTLPGRRHEIKAALLEIVAGASSSLGLRSWTFLPDLDLTRALLERARQGVQVSVICSHRTLLPPLDLVSRALSRGLGRPGLAIYRYASRPMHGKEAWNDQGDILLGSANVDGWSLRRNYECSLRISSRPLAWRLQQNLWADLPHCRVYGPAAAPPQHGAWPGWWPEPAGAADWL